MSFQGKKKKEMGDKTIKRIYLENSPLGSSTLMLINQLKTSSEPVAITPIVASKSIPKKISSTDEKIVINFPLEIGISILKDKDSSYFWSTNYDQEYINNNIKEAIGNTSIKKLITCYKVSICDLRTFRVIVDLDSLKKAKFRGFDLSLNRALFNTAHLKTLFDLNYRDLVKGGISFNLFAVVKGGFSYNELSTILFDFDLCFKQTSSLIDPNWSEKDKLKYKNEVKECFKELYTPRQPQLTFTQMKTLNLQNKHLADLGIKIEDIKRYDQTKK